VICGGTGWWVMCEVVAMEEVCLDVAILQGEWLAGLSQHVIAVHSSGSHDCLS